MGNRYVKGNEPTAQDIQDGKYLKADGTWDTPSGGGGGSSTLAGLTDVNIPNPVDGDLLKYNASTSKWERYTPTTTQRVYQTTFEWKRGSNQQTQVSVSYTAPSDGYIFANKYIANANYSYCSIEGYIYDSTLEEYVIMDVDADTSDYHTWKVGFPVKKGDQIQTRTRLDSGTLPNDCIFRFFS